MGVLLLDALVPAFGLFDRPVPRALSFKVAARVFDFGFEELVGGYGVLAGYGG